MVQSTRLGDWLEAIQRRRQRSMVVARMSSRFRVSSLEKNQDKA